MVRSENISLKQVETNNLKSINTDFPLGKFTVVTGVSGSGKSSLVFDTLYAESYRRYVESLSSFARQYLKVLPKPLIGNVENLPPSIAVQQTRSGANNRSTVGTLTEITDLLRISYFHLSKVECYQCGKDVEKDNAASIYNKLLNFHDGKKSLILSSLDTWKNLKVTELKKQLSAQGFTRILNSKGVMKIAESKANDLKGAHVVIDRITLKPDSKIRLLDSLNLAIKLGRGKVSVSFGKSIDLTFTSFLECCNCSIRYSEPSIALFSFNHPVGACSRCQGYGNIQIIDWEKVVAGEDSSIKLKGVKPFNFGKHIIFYTKMLNNAVKNDIDPSKKFGDYTDSDWDWFRNGDGGKYKGVESYFGWLDKKKYKPHYRMHAAKFKKYVTCPDCDGARLSKKSLACKIEGNSIADSCDLSIENLTSWIYKIELSHQSKIEKSGEGMEQLSHGDAAIGVMGIEEAVEEVKHRLNYLSKIGLQYLTVNRPSPTLSGGELQRIKMARCLGSSLTETLFCLDEPTAGLHVRDSLNLLEVIKDLRDQGNTVVVVEHEDQIIAGSDYLIEIGPGAGHKGGLVTYSGDPKGLPDRITSLDEKKDIQKLVQPKFIELKGASANNLKNIDVKFPLSALISVCGVSGSGKTSLIQHTFYPLLAKYFNQEALGYVLSKEESGRREKIGPPKNIGLYQEVVMVSQTPLGRSSRSNIATYLGVFDQVRKIFSEQPLAVKLDLKPGAFSFNVSGGRCEVCQGIGTVKEDLSFLGEMAVCCISCAGNGFKDEVLAVEYKGKNLIDVLNLTVGQAREFFFDDQKIVKVIDEVINMGLGYLTLRQSTSSFSGGEAQRLKLLKLLRQSKDLKPSILIFDEPTTGLSDFDVGNLLNQLRVLTGRGHMVIVVEHHLKVIESSDWVIEIGPEAADKGGQLVYEGHPGDLHKCKESVTGKYLRRRE